MAGPTLTWDTQGDWDAAQSRARVVSRDVGVRVPDQLWQGYDPNYAPLTDAVAYWPCDGSTFTDEIGTADGVANVTSTGANGVLSSNAFQYDGVDDVTTVDAMPLADPSASWTVNLWVYLTSRLSYRLYFSLEDSVAEESLGIGNWNTGATKIYSAGRTPGTGSDIALGEWTMMTLRWDADTQTASLFKNGTFDYDVAPSGGGSVFANADQLTIGNRRVGANAPTEGRLNEFILFDRALTDAEIQSLYDTVSSGTLTTATQAGDTEALELTTTAAVPTGTTAYITVRQYDGVTSNSETLTLTNGTQVHTLSNFAALDGATYWLDITQESTTVEETTQLDTATLQLAEAEGEPTPSDTLIWETEADWDGAQSRERVVATTMGDRSGDTLALGYDPSDAPTSSATSYWHYDEDTGTHADVIGGRTASRSEATAGVSGMLGSTAISFDGSNDYVSVGNNSVFNNLTEMTMAMWVKTNTSSTSGYKSLVGKGDLSGTAGSFLIEFDDNLLTLYVGSYSDYDEAPAQSFSSSEWHHVAVTWTSGEGARLYIDGVRVFSGTGTQRSMPSNSSALVFGSDLPYGTYYDGEIDEPMFFRSRLSDADIETLYETGRSGSLTTAAQVSSGVAHELATTANIPAGASITATVYQDTSGDSVADHSQTVSLSTGADTNALTNFEAASGSTYWIEFDLATTDPSVTPELTTAAVTTDAMSQLFVGTVDIAGTLVDIPIYDTDSVARATVRMRDDITGEVGAANIVDAETATALVRHPTDGVLGIEAYTRTSSTRDVPQTGAYGTTPYGTR